MLRCTKVCRSDLKKSVPGNRGVTKRSPDVSNIIDDDNSYDLREVTSRKDVTIVKESESCME